MLEKVVVLYLIVANCDTGLVLFRNRIVIDGFSVSGNYIEDCRSVGVRAAKKYTAYYRQWYPNASTNVDCQWEEKEMKAYKDCDEWLDSLPDNPFGRKYTCEQWAREGWKQAMRTARVQEIILLGEMKKLRVELEEMEKKWTDGWPEDNE